MISVAELLLSQENECNGHKQNMMSGLSIFDGLNICDDLEQLAGYSHLFVCQVFTDYSFDIYQLDYWKEGEHPLGHKDRLILSVE